MYTLSRPSASPARSRSDLPRHARALRWAMAIFIAGLLLQGVVQWRIASVTSPGLALDDGYIHLTFARNLMRGLGMAYNPGETVAGSTAPAWNLLLAATAIRSQWLMGAAIAWGAVFYAATAAFTAWMGLRLGLRPLVSVLAGVMVLLTGRLVWAGASGMEICAFALLSLPEHSVTATTAARAAHRCGQRFWWALPPVSGPKVI